MKIPPDIVYLHPFEMPSSHAHAIQIINTTSALARAGARVTLFVRPNPQRPVRSDEEALAAFRLTPHPNLTLRWLPRHKGLAGLVVRWHIWRKRDVVFWSRHLRLAIAAGRAGHCLVIAELHDAVRETAEVVRSVDGLVALTGALRDRVRELYAPTCPFEVISGGANLELFKPPTASGPPRVIYTGSLKAHKGVDTLIAALAKIPGLPALVIGGEPHDARRTPLQEMARKLGVDDRTEWSPGLPQNEMAQRLRAGDIAIVPTRAETGCPLKLTEYMALGLPIVASDIPTVREIMREGENGLLFRDRDAEALAQAIQRLIEQPELARSLGRRALEDSRQYSWDARAQKILSFIDTVVKAGENRQS